MTPSSKSGTGKEANHDRPRVDPRIRQRRAAIARRQGRRRLRVVAALLVVIVLAVVAFGVLHTTFFSAQKVEVTGQHPHTSTAAILSAAGLTGHPPLIDVNPGASAAKVERLPWIATARVIRTLAGPSRHCRHRAGRPCNDGGSGNVLVRGGPYRTYRAGGSDSSPRPGRAGRPRCCWSGAACPARGDRSPRPPCPGYESPARYPRRSRPRSSR